MIHKHKGEFVATCTECGTEEYGGIQEDFQAFVKEIRDAGWKVKKDGDEWQHLCPDCRIEDGP